eukprot:498855-Amphidinium_carterae.1
MAVDENEVHGLCKKSRNHKRSKRAKKQASKQTLTAYQNVAKSRQVTIDNSFLPNETLKVQTKGMTMR